MALFTNSTIKNNRKDNYDNTTVRTKKKKVGLFPVRQDNKVGFGFGRFGEAKFNETNLKDRPFRKKL